METISNEFQATTPLWYHSVGRDDNPHALYTIVLPHLFQICVHLSCSYSVYDLMVVIEAEMQL